MRDARHLPASDRLWQGGCEAQAKAETFLRTAFITTVKSLKYKGNIILVNTDSCVRYNNFYFLIFVINGNIDLSFRRCIFKGIVKKVDYQSLNIQSVPGDKALIRKAYSKFNTLLFC